MRVGIDAKVFSGHLTGIGNYTFNMVRSCLALNNSIVFVGFRNSSLINIDAEFLDGLNSDPRKHGGVVSRLLAYSKHQVVSRASRYEFVRSLYNSMRRYRFLHFAREGSFDLFHAYNYVPPVETGGPILPVIYDLSFLRYPETHPRERLNALKEVPKIVERALFVQTISDFTKGELHAVLNCRLDKIVVAPPAANKIFRPHGEEGCRRDLEALRLKHGQYFLSVGTLEPRKNLTTIINAYSRLPSEARRQFPLVVVGSTGWGSLDLPIQTARLVREGSIRFVGAIPNECLRSLYEGARLLLYPSIYEGFGMPVVEALACGSPVAYSSGTAMEEIAGGIGQASAATDVVGWTDLMRMAIDTNQYSVPVLRQRRICRAQQFSWVRSAAKVLDIYGSIGGAAS